MWCNQSGNHWEENLAKFGYKLDMKVREKKIIFGSWLPTRTYLLKYYNLDFFSLKSGQFGLFFSWKFLLIDLRSLFSGSNLAEFCQIKKDHP